MSLEKFELGDSYESLLKLLRNHESLTVREISLLIDKDAFEIAQLMRPSLKREYIGSRDYKYEGVARLDPNISYYLTSEGENYLEVRSRITNKFLIASVYIPLAVALITSGLFNWLWSMLIH